MGSIKDYPEFLNDIESAFANLIIEYGFKIVFSHEGCYEMEGQKCILRIAYDRGEVSCNLKDASSTTQISFGYPALPVLQYLHPNIQKLVTGPVIFDPKEQLLNYARMISTYLRNVLEGDFSWVSEFLNKERDYYSKVKYVREEFAYDHPIYQKFNNGDKTWQDDLDSYLTIHKISL